MLQKIRERSQGLVAGIIVGLIAVLMALFGLQYYLSNMQRDDYVAKVNGDRLRVKQFERLYHYQKSMLTHAQQDALTEHPDLVPIYKSQLLTQIVGRILYQQVMDQMPLVVTDAMVQAQLMSNPSFLKDGSFSQALYERYLRSALMTSEEFLNRRQLTIEESQFRHGLAGSDFVLATELEQALAGVYAQRDLAYCILDAKTFQDAQMVTDAEVKAYFDAHRADYAIPERVKLAYLVLDRDVLKRKVHLSSQDVAKAVEDQKVSHDAIPTKQLKAGIEANLLSQRIAALYSESRERLADLVYTHPNSLATAAEALDLREQETAWLALADPGGEASLQGSLPEGLAAHRSTLLKALKSAEVWHDHNNSGLLALGDDKAMVFRIKARIAKHEQPMDHRIAAQVRSHLRTQKAKVAMRERVDLIESKLQSGAKLDALAKQYHVTWHRENQVTVSTPMKETWLAKFAFVLQGDPKQKPLVGQVPLDDQRFAVVQVLALRDAKPTAKEREALTRRMARLHAAMSTAQYLLPSISRAKIDVPKQSL